MSNRKGRTVYDNQYDTVARAARLLPPERLIVSLELAFAKNPQDEADWGVIDALADLLAKAEPAEWWQGLL